MLAKQRALGGQSIGLLGLEERVRLAGGSFSISSVPSEGTRLELCFPLTEQQLTTPEVTAEVISP
jgi:two-component system sensor histidine kinase UhpB